MINGETIAFFILSMMAISGAIFMIQFSHVIHMSLSLAFTFFSIAGIYLLLSADFLAVIQVLIYAGAITILMLFGIMLTKHREESKGGAGTYFRILSFVTVGVVFAALLTVIYRTPLSGGMEEVKNFTIFSMSELIFKHYVIPFEITSVLLLIALVGAVILARKEEA